MGSIYDDITAGISENDLRKLKDLRQKIEVLALDSRDNPNYVKAFKGAADCYKKMIIKIIDDNVSSGKISSEMKIDNLDYWLKYYYRYDVF
jgi:hypothetical protein